MTKAVERMSEMESGLNTDSFEDDSQTELICTKHPVHVEAKFDGGLFCQIDVHETVAILSLGSFRFERVSTHRYAGLSRPLFLSLGILLI